MSAQELERSRHRLAVAERMVKTSATAPRHPSAVLPAMALLPDRVLAVEELGMRDALTRDFAESVQRGAAELWSLLLVLAAVAAELRGAFQDDSVIPEPVAGLLAQARGTLEMLRSAAPAFVGEIVLGELDRVRVDELMRVIRDHD
jgi:hypothetical protein